MKRVRADGRLLCKAEGFQAVALREGIRAANECPFTCEFAAESQSSR